MEFQPPKWAKRFLKWYCRPDILEEIEGDIHELFHRNSQDHGLRIARRRFAWDVLRFFRWSNIKKSNKLKINSFIMFSSYFKIGFRNLAKNWVISGINIVGLAIAIGVAITTVIFVDSQHNMETFHAQHERIYEVLNHVRNEDGIEVWGDSPILLGPALKASNSIVEAQTRVQYQYGSVRRGQNVFHEKISFVDPDLMRMFDFPMQLGNKSALSQRKNVVISNVIAEKYFAYEDPIGEDISIKFNNGKIHSFTVTGVLDKRPINASFFFHIMIPMENLSDIYDEVEYDWSEFADGNFVMLQAHHTPDEIQGLDEYIRLQNASDTKFAIEKLEFLPLDQASLRSHEIHGDIAVGGHPAGRIALGIIATSLLILACFNYMNISVASSTKRLKEIALRKVMGGIRRNIIHQFLAENLLLCTISMFLGIVLSYYLFTPGFDAMIPFEMPFVFSSFKMAFLFFTGLLILIALASGAYPALYISRFQPISIFRGSEKLGGKNLFSKMLLTMQLTLACTAVVACLVFTDNAIYLNQKSWGYNPEGILSIAVQNEQQFNALKKESELNPFIKMSEGAQGHIGQYDKNTTVEYLDKKLRTHIYKVSPGYLQLMEIPLLQGKLFDDIKSGEASNQTVINQIFADKMGWTDPLDKRFSYDSVNYRVIGVVDNYYLYYFNEAVEPAFFIPSDKSEFDRFVLKIEKEKMFEVDEQFAEVWYSIAPNDPYVRDFQEDTFNDFYRENKANIALMVAISILSILLGCLGLFGIFTFNIQRRIKEFGVRKVLGAGSTSIFKMANKEFVWVVVTAFVFGAFLGTYMIASLIGSIYADPKPIGPWPIVTSMLIMLVTIGITIMGQTAKAIKINPAEVLRRE